MFVYLITFCTTTGVLGFLGGLVVGRNGRTDKLDRSERKELEGLRGEHDRILKMSANASSTEPFAQIVLDELINRKELK